MINVEGENERNKVVEVGEMGEERVRELCEKVAVEIKIKSGGIGECVMLMEEGSSVRLVRS